MYSSCPVSDRSNSFGPGTSLVWNSPLRTLHVALLLEGGLELASEFWLGHPLETENGTLVGAELFEHIWAERALSPLDYQLRVLDSVEAFCLHRGVPFLPFVRERVFGNQSGTILTPKESLAMVGKLLLHLVRSRDIHWTVLELLDVAGREIAPQTKIRVFGRKEMPDGNQGWIVHIHDREYRGRHPGFDAAIWFGCQIELSPARIGCAPFRSVCCVCEVRDISHILESVPRGLHPSRGLTGWTLDGRTITRTVSFHEWALRQGIDLAELDVPDHPVQEALEDLECPARKRVVVHAGAAYGSKVYLHKVAWAKHASFSMETGLAQLIGEATRDKLQAEELHEDLLKRFRQRLSFLYHPSDSTISCNGEHLLRGVPAKILQKVLMAHTLTGRTQFEHREFRRDPDLGLDPLNPNLEGRIRILSDRLEERLQGIRIQKSGRGRFELEAKTLVEFAEE